MSREHVEKFCDRLIYMKEHDDKTAGLTPPKYKAYTKIDISVDQIGRYLNKTEVATSIKLDTLVKFADYYKVSIDYLIGRTNITKEKCASDVTGLSQKAIKKLNRCKNDPEKKKLVKALSDIIENSEIETYADDLVALIEAFENGVAKATKSKLDKMTSRTQAKARVAISNSAKKAYSDKIQSALKEMIQALAINKISRRVFKEYRIK